MLLTQDILGTCLILAKGDLSATVERLAALGNAFEEDTGRRLGSSMGDWPSILRWLLVKTHGTLSAYDDDTAARTMLGKIAPHMLAFDTVYCNDEGESWEAGTPSIDDVRWFTDLTDAQIQESTREREALLAYLDTWGDELPGPAAVQQFMEETGIGERTLARVAPPPQRASASRFQVLAVVNEIQRRAKSHRFSRRTGY